ncbi:ADP-ribosylglycohydrolase family protein [Nesterenkonia sp. NBAIMH1]|uniref:ADP-ribosylglycohydrolase family protein n=1 Tax=Nesterenkonia sp. NBAIMH1 TaxID=2600320 RepID=UPI00143DBA67|nr:ADP-ribosylglycohydrolase family protein [Nesterenkonia sp. NBAIMH1]
MNRDTLTDEELIAQFQGQMTALLPGRDEPIHAETLLTLCLADGLLEVLEWSAEGTGADPLAAMWLACLRWHRAVTGSFPEGSPQPPRRPTDHALALILQAGGSPLVPGSAESSLRGLASADMAYPSSPAQPEAYDTAVLSRAVPIGLFPYVGVETRKKWAQEAISLTHGHPDVVAAAQSRVAEVTAGEHSEQDLSEEQSRHELLSVVVEDLARRWRQAAQGA